MERSLLVGGFGGQGIMVIGQLLSYTAVEQTEKFVTFFPSYGSEQRGGTANCYVVISDEPIGAPHGSVMDDVMVLNDPSMLKFESIIRPGGALFVNSTIVTTPPKRTDITVINVPATEIADKIGNARVANLAMVGAYIGYSDLLPPDKVLATTFEKLGSKRPQLNPLNQDAFEQGLAIGKAAKK